MTAEAAAAVDASLHTVGVLRTRARPSATVRIVTADEHSLVREGLAAVINGEPGMKVIAHAGTGAAAIDAYRAYRPDVLTLDLLLPDMPGEHVAAQIMAEFPNARIVVITSVRGDVHMLRALESGVKGIVSKGMDHRELLETIRQVHAGRKVIPRQVAATLAEHVGEEGLTRRELQVLRLAARGNRNKQIAAHLSIADETVRMHMKNILSKLGAHDRTHAVTIALMRGIFQLSEPVLQQSHG